jgi:Na+-transporting NADH:ubiquinone oxidoreductase subunit A
MIKKGIIFLSVVAISSFAHIPLMAQNDGGSGSDWFSYSMIITAALVFLGAMVVVAQSLVVTEAKRSGVDLSKQDTDLFSGIRDWFRSSFPDYLKGQKLHLLSNGYDIALEGGIEKSEIRTVKTTRYALQPPNFRGIRPIPKLEIEEGDTILAGDAVFYDKENPEVKYVSPVSGEFIELRRGAKRAIEELVVLADQENQYREIPAFDLEKNDRDALKKHLMEYGGWPLIIERPFDVVPDPESDPKSIFVSTFDSAPMAPDYKYIVEGRESEFQKGLDVLGKLTDGHVYLGLDARTDNPPAEAFTNAEGVKKHYFRGPHPSGNVGVQIHHIDPIRSREKVWTVDVQNVIRIGALFTQRKYLGERIIGITGSEVNEPEFVKTYVGANIGELLKDNLKEGDKRIINGNVLHGDSKNEEQYLNEFSNQISVIEEGDYYEPFGWLIPNKLRPSYSRTYPNFLLPGIRYKADTNTHGEKRAFVYTGLYDKLMPMDIYLQELMKSIMINDFERMEGLGILELSEEDVALAEFACVSKMPLQRILREGLDYVKSQM